MNWIGLLTLFLLSQLAVLAHKPSDSYLSFNIRGGQVSGQWDISLRDLEYAVGLDTNDDGAISWGELMGREQAVTNYAFSRLQVGVTNQWGEIRFGEMLVDNHTDGAYAVLQFAVTNLPPGFSPLRVRYQLLFDTDPQHRGLCRVQTEQATQTEIFSPDQPVHDFSVTKTSSATAAWSFLREGVWHIWIGFDHILFLIALLLPTVVARVNGRWEVATRIRPVLINVLKVVTAFTAAHSITLTLSTLGWVTLPSRFVESVIAASVVAAALNNLRPVFSERAWMIAFSFGLIHGFGFASVLADLGLPANILALALVSFNVGVEIGQLAIVSVFIPLAFTARRSWFYQCLTFQVGSAGIALIAATWMCERIFNFKVLPF